MTALLRYITAGAVLAIVALPIIFTHQAIRYGFAPAWVYGALLLLGLGGVFIAVQIVRGIRFL